MAFDGEPLPVAAGQVDPPEPAPGRGEAAQAPPSPEEALGRLARAPVERFAFALTLPPEREGELVVRGVVRLEQRFLPSGYSLSVETDFREQLVLTPLTQYATPQVILLPSVGLGVGVPVQVLPDVRPGLRLLADLHFGPVGAALSWDHYPRLREGSDSFSRLALLFQVGL